jgi:hypothetical protein
MQRRDDERWDQTRRLPSEIAQADEQWIRRPAPPREEQASAAPPAAPATPERPAPRLGRLLRQALSSRQTLRQAVLLQEILGKPKGLV